MHWIALLPPSAEAPAPGRAGTPDEAAAQRQALGWWALQFTPRVALVDEAVLLEVSACERLWGGRDRLLARICEQNQPLAPAAWAQGATSLIAIALLRLAVQGARAPQSLPAGLPLDSLSAAREHLATLARAGCSTWGDLRALPRGGVARRFGAPLLEALDAAYGSRPDSHAWLTLPEVFELQCELVALAETAPALMFGAQRLLAQLRAWLQARHSGVLALELVWLLDARRSNSHIRGVALPPEDQLVIRTAEPTQDMAHIGRLLAEHLARITLAAPVHSLRLRSLETASLVTASASLLPEARAQGDSLHQLVERLSARLGAQQVLQAVAQADHRPECLQRWQPALESIASKSHGTGASGRNGCKPEALYPSWLLREPLRLVVRNNRPQYQGPLRLLAGPQRLEAGWWGSEAQAPAAMRDYFIARSEQAGLLWIYRERWQPAVAQAGQGAGPATSAPQAHRSETHRWFLHGLYA